MIRFCLLISLALLAGPLAADGDHDRARAALERGEILPLSAILDAARAEVAGRVIEVELERDDGRWLYELEVVTEAGRLVEMEIDAATARVLEVAAEDDDERRYRDGHGGD
ncbi:MAG: PepSY domain-containing protein [Paracoccaceae bacterium]|jgi:uncharacterized membrane protein YkoI|nr:PepSY domain-containing protein [Paracoccaceae bacterium]